MNKDKMIKNAKTLYTIANIVQKLLIAAAVLLFAGVILMLVFMKDTDTVSTTSLSLGSLTVELAENSPLQNMLGMPHLILTIIPACIILAVTIYELKIVKDILTPLKNGSPFDTSVSVSIRKLGTAVLWGGLLSEITSVAGQHMMLSDPAALMELFNRNVVTGITVNYEFDMNFIFIAMILFLLSYVFRYGEELQRESDETL